MPVLYTRAEAARKQELGRGVETQEDTRVPAGVIVAEISAQCEAASNAAACVLLLFLEWILESKNALWISNYLPEEE